LGSDDARWFPVALHPSQLLCILPHRQNTLIGESPFSRLTQMVALHRQPCYKCLRGWEPTCYASRVATMRRLLCTFPSSNRIC
jgi:hypothetical protein